MYSYNDFERLFVRYKLEGVPSGVSIEKFCMSNKVLSLWAHVKIGC